MVVDNISEFLINNEYRSKFLSIDFGLKNLGIAISDDTNLIAIPFKTLNELELLNQLPEIMREYNIYGLIIGKPYNLDGSTSKMIENVNVFIQKLLNIKDILAGNISDRPLRESDNPVSLVCIAFHPNDGLSDWLTDWLVCRMIG